MQLTYICAPYRNSNSEIQRGNIERIRKFCEQYTIKNPDEIPVATPLYLPQFIIDENTAQRICLALVEKCDKFIVLKTRFGITEMMEREIVLAEKLNKKMIEVEVEELYSNIIMFKEESKYEDCYGAPCYVCSARNICFHRIRSKNPENFGESIDR